MIAWALTGPIPGSLSSCSLLAVLILIFSPGASFAAEALAEGALDAAGAGAAGAGAGAAEPTVTKGFKASICLVERPDFERSSTDLYGRPAVIFFAVAGPTPLSASSSFWEALFKSS